jgi:hypothetical protein
MNKSVSIKTLGVGLVTALVVGAFGGSLVSNITGNKFGTYPVKLTPEDDGKLVAEVEDKSKKCKNNDNAGCMRFDKDANGVVKFYLDGSKYKSKSCKNSQEVITKIELTTTGEGNKGVFNDGLGWVEPAVWLKENAFPSVNLETGIAYEATLAEARSLVILSNMNNHDASEGEKVFWYRVTVSACEGSEEPWVSDPRGENKGVNF